MGTRALKVMLAVAMFALPIVGYVGPARADGIADLLALVNSLRGTVGIAPLATDPSLTTDAQQWANAMAVKGVLSHNPNLASQAPTGWTKLGENIGNGYSLSGVYTSLAGTNPSRGNFLDPAFNRTGVGVATDSKGQVWLAEDFGAYAPPTPATFVFPTNGTVILPSPQPFSWNQVPGSLYYCLTVGTKQGGSDLVSSAMLPATQLSYAVPGLPGGQGMWARIYTFSLGAWTFTDAKFSVAGASTATFTVPSQGAVNVDTTQPFTWSPVGGASYYGLTVGTTKGGYDLVNTGPLPAARTSYAVPALPSGKTLWARIYSQIAGSWAHYNDVSFTAAPR